MVIGLSFARSLSNLVRAQLKSGSPPLVALRLLSHVATVPQ
jgi:hypothetical protein